MSQFRWCRNFKNPSRVKTAALQLYVDSTWESADIVNGIRFHNNSDSLLYGIAYLSDGDTESNIIPKGSIALAVPSFGYSPVVGSDDWSMPITFNSEYKILLCFPGNTYIDAGGRYIVNEAGEPLFVDSITTASEPANGTIWEF